jgi:DtxR family transcriptional regulator, Mn-dependent transcriptional regulator
MLSQTEENYLKIIFKLTQETQSPALTNAIATQMRTAAGTVTDMIRRLAEKQLVHYEKYKGVTLTEQGTSLATTLVRKHRLWEVFLHDKLGFAWHEVHDIAEELEHISSLDLVNRLDSYLGNPKFDPHGDPIPNANGQFAPRRQVALFDVEIGQSVMVTGVNEHAPEFLNYLQDTGLTLGSEFKVLDRLAYDHSFKIRTHAAIELHLSEKVARNLFVQSTQNV